MRYLALVSIVALMFVTLVACIVARILCEPCVSEFETIGTAFAGKGPVVQGMSPYDEDHFLLLGRDGQGTSTVHKIEFASRQPAARFALPPEADDARGLAFREESIVVLNGVEDKLYLLKPKASFDEGEAVVAFVAMLRDLGDACCFFVHNRRRLLAVAEAGENGRIHILDYRTLVDTREASRATVASYHSGGYAQAIAYRDGVLLVANHTLLGVISIEATPLDDVFAGDAPNQRRLLLPLTSIRGLVSVDTNVMLAIDGSGHYCTFRINLEGNN